MSRSSWVVHEEQRESQAVYCKIYRTVSVLAEGRNIPVGSEITRTHRVAKGGKSYEPIEPIVDGNLNELRRIAQTISAAPEMLEALKLLLSFDEALMDKVMSDPKRDTLAWRIKVAISKADPGYFPGFQAESA